MTPLSVVSVGRDHRGVILWVATEDADHAQDVRLTDAEAFDLVGQLTRAIHFPISVALDETQQEGSP